jgi:hypothetical protein
MVQTTCIKSLSYPLAPTVTALRLETDLADKRNEKKQKENLSWSLCADIISGRIVVFAPKMEARPRSLATGHFYIWIAIALDYVPSAGPIAKASGHDKHHAQKAMAATGSHE